MDWTAKNDVAGTVLTVKHVTISVECVIMVVRMDTLETTVLNVRSIFNSHFVTPSRGVLTRGLLCE